MAYLVCEFHFLFPKRNLLNIYLIEHKTFFQSKKFRFHMRTHKLTIFIFSYTINHLFLFTIFFSFLSSHFLVYLFSKQSTNPSIFFFSLCLKIVSRAINTKIIQKFIYLSHYFISHPRSQSSTNFLIRYTNK